MNNVVNCQIYLFFPENMGSNGIKGYVLCTERRRKKNYHWACYHVGKLVKPGSSMRKSNKEPEDSV